MEAGERIMQGYYAGEENYEYNRRVNRIQQKINYNIRKNKLQSRVHM